MFQMQISSRFSQLTSITQTSLLKKPNQNIRDCSPTLQKESLGGRWTAYGVYRSDAERPVLLEFPGESLLQAQFGPSPVSPFGVVPKTKAV